MFLAKRSKTLLSAAGVSLALLMLTAGASLAQNDSQTNNCPCCQKMGQDSRT